jgi:hypothetical protein
MKKAQDVPTEKSSNTQNKEQNYHAWSPIQTFGFSIQ